MLGWLKCLVGMHKTILLMPGHPRYQAGRETFWCVRCQRVTYTVISASAR